MGKRPKPKRKSTLPVVQSADEGDNEATTSKISGQ